MGNDVSVIKEKVKSYVVQSAYTDEDKISEESLIFKEGYIDSMGFVLLISFLEEEFSIKTGDADLLEENFESINAISDFVLRKSMN